MESQDHAVRQAMREMRRMLTPSLLPKVCLRCVGWEHFGGVQAKDVSMGPICVCDKNWFKVKSYLNKKLLPV